MGFRTRSTVVLLSVVLLVACGGTDDAGEETTTVAASGDAPSGDTGSGDQRATLTVGDQVHEFTDARACIVEEGRTPPVIATFGDEVTKTGDGLQIGRASSDFRFFVWIDDVMVWDTRTDQQPTYSGTSASWDGLELQRLDGGPPDTVSVTVDC